MDQPGEAAAILERLLAEAGRDPALLANLAICRLAAQDLGAAAALADEAAAALVESDVAVSSPPVPGRAADGRADVCVIQAAVRLARGRPDEAVAMLRATVTAHPAHQGAAYALVTALEAGGRSEAGAPDGPSASSPAGGGPPPAGASTSPANDLIRAYEHLSGLAARNTHVLLRLAELHAREGDASAALRWLDRFAAVVPDMPEAVRQDWHGLPQAAAGDARRVLSVAVRTKNVMRATDRYRADVMALGPAPGALPHPVPHPLQLKVESRPAAPSSRVRFVPAGGLLPVPPDDVIDVAIGSVTDDRAPALYLVRSGGAGRLWVRRGTVPSERQPATPASQSFRDETDAAGLSVAPACSAALFVDLNNDRRMDLLLCGAFGMRGYGNEGDGRFRDATETFGLASYGPTRGALPFDFDHDGDLDLVRWDAARPYLHRNDGEGRLSEAVERPGFPASLPGIRRAHGLDLDDDGDTDLAFVTVSSPATPTTSRGSVQQNGEPAFPAAGGSYSLRVISNERLATFREVTQDMKGLPESFAAEPILDDMDNDGWLEVINPSDGCEYPVREEFAVGEPIPGKRRIPLIALGTTADVDCDGTVELLVVRDNGVTDFAGLTFAAPVRPYAVDLTGDGLPDIIGANGQAFINNTQNAGHWLSVSLAALIQGDSKFNAFGISSTVEIRAGGLYQKRHVSRPWTHFGLGPYATADVLRVVWPNGSYQNVSFRASDRTAIAADRLVVEEQSLKGSCPYLYAWNGERFEFVTDVLWRSALGMSIMSGVFGHHGPADDYFKIEGERLAPRDGKLVLQFTEELWETAYFDYSRLFAVDHPAGAEVFVDEKCLAPPYPPFEIYRVAEARAPRAAVDGAGRDLLPLLLHRDRRYVGGFELTRYQGIVADHDLILDLGPFPQDEQVRLFLQGWLWPTDASTNVAVSQNPTLDARPPALSVRNAAGEWTALDMTVGFPSGKDKTIVLDLTGRFPADDHHVRLSTNFAIYWDRAFFTVGPQEFDLRVTELPVAAADLHHRGSCVEYRSAPEGPMLPDYDTIDHDRVWRDLVGDYTRFGDVTPLVRDRDGSYAIVGPGDEVTLLFDAAALPALPDGWRRDYIVHTDGWLKDGDLNSATGKTVEPLPYPGMSAFPPPAGEAAQAMDGRRQEFERWHTRRRDAAAFRAAIRPGG